MVTHAATFGGGDGSLAKPYLISTPEHLNELRETVNGGETYYGVYFKQTASIDFKNYDIDDDPTNGNFTPIGGTNAFQGNYDGDYHTISNVKLVSDQTYTGFFGYISNNASLENMNFENLTVQSSGRYTGGLVGYATDASLTNISVHGAVNSTYYRTSSTTYGYTGGIVGYANSNLFKMDSINFSGIMTSSSFGTGGIIGGFYSAKSFSNLSVSGTIKSTYKHASGLAGSTSSESLYLENGLSVAQVIGPTTNGIIYSTYANSKYFKNLYWDKNNSTTSYGNSYNSSSSYQVGMTGLTTDQLQGEAAKTNLVGFDFENTWETTDGYPRLKWLNKLKFPLTPGTHEVLLAGKVEPTLLSLTVPADPINFVINPNLPDEEMFVAPKFQITNATKIPVSLTLHSFEKVTGPFNDVLPTEHDDWFNLETSELFDFALGIQPEPGQGWRSLTEGVRYVADKSNYELGILEPKGTVNFKLVANHGSLFNTSFETTYRLTFIVGV